MASHFGHHCFCLAALIAALHAVAHAEQEVDPSRMISLAQVEAKDLVEQCGVDLTFVSIESLDEDTEQLKALLAVLRRTTARTHLSFPKVEQLSAEVLKLLSTFRGDLSLDGLQELSPETAESLVVKSVAKKGDIASRSFNALTTLDPQLAGAIARHRGPLRLNGVDAIDDEIAGILAKHKAPLSLNGLTDTPPDRLFKHQGGLSLNGLPELDLESARQLAATPGPLVLDGLQSADNEVLAALAQHRGLLSLGGLSKLTEVQAELLGKHQGDLVLDGLEYDESGLIVRKLEQHCGGLSLRRWRSISKEYLAALGKSNGLCLDGLTDESLDLFRETFSPCQYRRTATSLPRGPFFLSLKGIANPEIVVLLNGLVGGIDRGETFLDCRGIDCSRVSPDTINYLTDWPKEVWKRGALETVECHLKSFGDDCINVEHIVTWKEPLLDTGFPPKFEVKRATSTCKIFLPRELIQNLRNRMKR